MQKSERIKAEVSLKQVAEAAGVVWDLKKSQPRKGDYWASCPFHGENSASFHVVEPNGTGGFFKCFGCHAGGTVIDFVMENSGIDFIAAVRRLAEDAGIAGQLSDERRQELEIARAKSKAASASAAQYKANSGHKHALDLWHRAEPVEPDLVAKYLTARGVRLSAIGGVPRTLRMLRGLPHRDGGKVTFTGTAMIGAIGRAHVLGVHRTWITKQGRARHLDGHKVSKQWIGRTGSLFGQPLVLSPPTPAVVVGEGIETTLTAWSGLEAAGKLGWCAEAGLSRGAITGPGDQLWTPRAQTKEVLILGEGSAKDPRAARELYEGAAARLKGLGLTVLLTVPYGRWDLDADFADVAMDEILNSERCL